MSYCGIITKVEQDSIAKELGLQPGDKIISINDTPLVDIIDYSFAIAEEEIELVIETADGEQELIEFEKDYGEDLGIEFESAVFDKISRCKNHCIFCFIEQMAPKMRKTLYVKDDDYRLSFLNGNFITLTNMTQEDYDRIYRLHLSPLYVSVHTTNGELRSKMLRSPDGTNIKEQLQELIRHGIELNIQIVLCPDWNDKEELEKTLADLYELGVLSVAIVPVGLTKYRERCYPLRIFTADEAKALVEQVSHWQEKARAEFGISMIYLSDEFYLMADMPLPPEEHYDGYPQIENGIGLTRSFLEEWNAGLAEMSKKGYAEPTVLDVICGTSAEKVLRPLFEAVTVPNLTLRLTSITNDFFGEKITVTGLLTGQDILAAVQARQMEGKVHGLLLPTLCLDSEESVFLDNMTVDELEEQLGIPVCTFQNGTELQDRINSFK